MKWRNEQIYHLRQNKPLSREEQDFYFKEVVSKLFDQLQPNQILFSFLENGILIGYGGLVHIEWIDQHAEVSFVMNTVLEKNRFQEIWVAYLGLIEQVAFQELKLHKIFTYAFDIRPHLYPALLMAGFIEEARLKEHCFLGGEYKDVLIYSKVLKNLVLRKALENDVNITFRWATNKIVREYAIQKEIIVFDVHENWFFKKINSDNCLYLIAEINGKSIGSIRFDIDEDNIAVVSFLLDPEFHGIGYGKKILQMGCGEILKFKDVAAIRGVVNLENIPSLKTFRSLGFNRIAEIDSYITFEKKVTI
jgi:RimJ/RimL family protein N-acetyltransferase